MQCTILFSRSTRFARRTASLLSTASLATSTTLRSSVPPLSLTSAALSSSQMSTEAAPTPITSRGAFIVFEGLDRSGKSTQVRTLVDSLNASGAAASLSRFPDRETTIGSMCGAYLQQKTKLDDHIIHLLFSANRWEAATSLRDKLAAGETVIVDRYSYSGIAYSAFKGLDWDWCCGPEVGLPAPDAVFYLTVSNEVAAARGGFGEEIYEKTEIQQKVQQAFETIRDRTEVGKKWVTIDADRTIEEVAAEVLQRARGVMQSVSGSEVGTFDANGFKVIPSQ